MFKAGIVGCGGIGLAHLRSWNEIPDTKVVAVADINENKARAAGEAAGCAWYNDCSLLPPDLDAVSVTTPPASHYPVVKALLKAGYAVFCEKPLTMETRQGEELDHLARENNLQLGVGFKMRFEPIFVEAKKHLAEIGKLVSVASTKLQPFNPRPEGEWVKKTGAMYELSIHDFDLITYITGLKAERVMHAHMRHRFGWEKEDAFSIMAAYGDGVTALLQGMYALKSTFCYRDLTLTFLGDDGYMRVERPDRIVLHTDQLKVIDVPQTQVNTFALELSHFKRAVLGEEENSLKAEDAIRLTRFINAASRLGSHADR